MVVLDELFRLYAAWKQLTLHERTALCNERWGQVEELQKAKAGLQGAILAYAEKVPRDFIAETAQKSLLQSQLQELMQLEQENLSVLSSRRQAAESKSAELARESRVLGQLRHSYVPLRPQGWSSYS